MKTLKFLTIFLIIFILYACANRSSKTTRYTQDKPNAAAFTGFNKSGGKAPQVFKPQKNRIVFDTSYFSEDINSEYYKIKIGMSINTVKAILRNEHYVIFNSKNKENMVRYKFRLLGAEYPYTPEYALAFARILKLEVISLYYTNKSLFLFFYKNNLYSIKIRHIKSSTKNFSVAVRKILRNLKYGDNVKNYNTDFGRKTLVNKVDGSVIELHYYKLDNSIEVTHYNSGPVKKVEKRIKFKIRQIISLRSKKNMPLASR